MSTVKIYTIVLLITWMKSWMCLEQHLLCPVKCTCKSFGGDKITACLDTGFQHIPSDISNSTVQLYLQGNNIRDLEENVFQGYPLLQIIVLTDSQIQKIHYKAFNGLEQITSLDLRDNKIRIIRSYTFSKLYKLNELKLEGNVLVVIEAFAFAGSGKHYVNEGMSINLEKNPFLKEIHVNAFQGANVLEIYIRNSSLSSNALEVFKNTKTSLSMIFLRDNKVSLQIPRDFFRGFKRLQVLNLENNGITNINFLRYVSANIIVLSHNPIGMFDFTNIKNLQNIRSLDISNIGYSTLNASHFNNMLNLSQLHLDANEITTLPPDIFPLINRLQYFSLSGNRLHCNCELLWFRKWLQTSTAQIEGAECNSPIKTAVRTAEESLFSCTKPSTVTIYKHLSHGVAKLICSSSGDPMPILTWIDPQNNARTVVPAQQAICCDKTVQAIFTVHSTDKSGIYTCKASNLRGDKLSTIKIDVYKTIAMAQYQEKNASVNLEQSNVIYAILIKVFILINSHVMLLINNK